MLSQRLPGRAIAVNGLRRDVIADERFELTHSSNTVRRRTRW